MPCSGSKPRGAKRGHADDMSIDDVSQQIERMRVKRDQDHEHGMMDLALQYADVIRQFALEEPVFELMQHDMGQTGFPAVMVAAIFHGFAPEEALNVVARLFERFFPPVIPGDDCYPLVASVLLDLLAALTDRVRASASVAIRLMIDNGKVAIDTRLPNGVTFLAQSVCAIPLYQHTIERITVVRGVKPSVGDMLEVIKNAAANAASDAAAEAMSKLAIVAGQIEDKKVLTELAVVIAPRITEPCHWSGVVEAFTDSVLLDAIVEVPSSTPAIIAAITKENPNTSFVRKFAQWIAYRMGSASQAVSTLFEQLIDADRRSNKSLLLHGNLPFLAAESGNTEMLPVLVRSYGPECLFVRLTDETAVEFLVRHQGADAVKDLLFDKDISTIVTTDGKETILHLAVQSFVEDRDQRLLKELVGWHSHPKIGAAIAAADSRGRTPLAMAVIGGKVGALVILHPLLQTLCADKKMKLEQAAALAADTGDNEALALAGSLRSLASLMSPWSDVLPTALHLLTAGSDDGMELVRFLIEKTGAALRYLRTADSSLLVALTVIPQQCARAVATTIGKDEFVAYLTSLCANYAANATSSLVVPLTELVEPLFLPSQFGLVPAPTSQVCDHFTVGMHIACALVSAEARSALHQCGFFFSAGYLTELLRAPHDNQMSPQVYEARQGLHRIIAPEVLFGMIHIAGVEMDEFQGLINKVEAPQVAESGSFEDIVMSGIWS